MEDSIALIDALAGERDIHRALAEFRRRREPHKQKLVSAAEKSFMWYEDVAKKLDTLEPVPFVFDFMTRTGRVDEARLFAEFPQFMQTNVAEWRAFAASAIGRERGFES